jgi:hypothetical protein
MTSLALALLAQLVTTPAIAPAPVTRVIVASTPMPKSQQADGGVRKKKKKKETGEED